MKARLVAMLRCPRCSTDFTLASGQNDGDSNPHHELVSGHLECTNGHRFPIIDAVPRLLAAMQSADAGSDTEESRSGAAKSIQATYDAMWSRFKPGDREWSNELEDRVEGFVKEVRATKEELTGKLVLDAGCGPGTLTRAITRYDCQAIGLDVSESVVTAFDRSSTEERERSHFVQGDLVDSPFRDGLFDIIYCGGVLHLNPDPKQAFQGLCRSLKPGGTMYIWVYGTVEGRSHARRQSIRDVLSRLPQRLRFFLILLWLPQAMLRQYVRTALGRNNERDRLKWRERFVHLLDHYTPQYRWELSHQEVRDWFDEAGFEDLDLVPEGMGFGVTATLKTTDLASFDA